MKEVLICPVCNTKEFRPFLKCKDYTVSRETFQIMQCLKCHFLFTSPFPDNDTLGTYYLSDSYASHAAQATTIQDKIYNLARTITLRWKLGLVNQHHDHISEKSILDFGCGTGQFLETCQSNGWQIQGIEPSDVARPQAEEITHTKIASIPQEIPPGSQYHAITLWHVLEHIPTLNDTIQSLRRSMHSSGRLYLAVPNHQSWDAGHYKETWAAYDVPRHLWHFTQTNMAQLLKNHSLEIEKIIPMRLDAFYVSLLSEKYKKTNAIAAPFKALINGLRSNLIARKTVNFSSLIYIARK